MVTDPRGQIFVSYRRARHVEVATLVRAMHDVGLPVWQDVADLLHEPTEDAIRGELRSPGTSGAVVFLTPEVRDSDFIRRVELPEILRRHHSRDGFWVLPVMAGGLTHRDVTDLLEGTVGAQELNAWNLRTADDPFTPASAAAIAAAAVIQRLAAAHSRMPADLPVRLRLNVRPSGRHAGDLLTLDWSNRVPSDAPPDRAVWDVTLLPALRTVQKAVIRHTGERPVILAGTPSLPGGFALGHSFSALDRRRSTWLQHDPAAPEQEWSLADAVDDGEARRKGWQVRIVGGAVGARDLAVLVNVTQDASNAFAASQADLPRLRATIILDRSDAVQEPPELRPIVRLTGVEAASLARMVRQTISNALSHYGPLDAIHLVLAGPAGLAVMIGQLTNTLPPVVTYDYLRTGSYLPAATLPPAMGW